MNYHEFPTERPSEEEVNGRAASAVVQYYRTAKAEKGQPVEIFTVTRGNQRSHTIVRVPSTFIPHLRPLLFRRFALALMLHHNPTLDIRPHATWITFAQNFLHVDSLWKECLAASDRSQTLDAKTISNILNKYLVTEMVVKRHEPVYLSQYRQRRTADKPNISHATWQELGESQCSEHTRD